MTEGQRTLRVSSSPRMTWIWAADADTATEVRQILDSGDHFWQPAKRGGAIIAHVTDVEVGVTALEACEALARAGFLFTWHDDQPIVNRDNWPSTLPGMPGQPR